MSKSAPTSPSKPTQTDINGRPITVPADPPILSGTKEKR